MSATTERLEMVREKRLADLLAEMDDPKTILTPDQDTEIRSFGLVPLTRELWARQRACKAFEHQIKLAKAKLSRMEEQNQRLKQAISLWAQASDIPEDPETGTISWPDPDDFFSVTVTPAEKAKGRVVLTGDIADVPRLYVKQRPELDVEMARTVIEAGQDIPAVEIRRETSVRINRRATGKQVEELSALARWLK